MADGISALIARIDAAVMLGDHDAITRQVKQELQDAIRNRSVTLPDRFHRVRSAGYARRLRALAVETGRPVMFGMLASSTTNPTRSASRRNTSTASAPSAAVNTR